MDDPLDVDPIVILESSGSNTTPSNGVAIKRKLTPKSSTKKIKKMTPEQEEAKRLRAEEKAKREEERLRKEEEKKQRQEERRKEQEKRNEEKRLQEIEKQRQLEERRKASEEKKRQLEEEKKLKMEEKMKKEEERKSKEEEKLKKLEEKKKMQEEKQRQEDEKRKQKEEEELKKKRMSESFKGFFRKQTDSETTSNTPEATNNRVTTSTSLSANGVICMESIGQFKPFQLKPNQELASPVPSFIKDNFSLGAFDSLFEGQYESEELYLKELKSNKINPIRVGKRLRMTVKKTSTQSSNDSEIQVLDKDGNPTKSSAMKNPVMKVKFLHFHENTRPAYFGTFRKKSKDVSGRRPFGQDKKVLNYEVDSEDEWDEGGPGESLKGSDDEAVDDGDDYEIDNEFFVPHGYLSDEEAEKEEEDDINMGKDGNFREKEMITRKNLKVSRLKPFSVGCIWSQEMKQPENYSAANLLKKYKMVLNGPVDVFLPRPQPTKEVKKRIRKKKDSTDSKEKMDKKKTVMKQ